ncbi:aminotransferase class V-fold PLP-dependent enzyme [Candidatus Pelagibacter sp.]|nr:aminotransferase class V-fold PLP-dependent enzyme [Candidatus Pelagibacter sp.]|tara:strand:+ start:340 stop:1539 length:1200 start_codon:yes stop_codon:yes gene_type:complete
MNKYFYPLIEDPFSNNDISEGIKVLKSKQLTISKKTVNFEKDFSSSLKSKYSLMVNSGSSANLLALQCLINPYRKNRLKAGDEVIIPTLCWSTSLWPIIQSNLKPVFVDINPLTLNIDESEVEKKITKKTKAILLVHVLGNSCDMDQIMKIKKKHNLILIEDTCESLGSKYNDKYLGTFGEFSSFSFYSSHQISSGEGGMICCKDKVDYNIIKSLRSHGWSRGTSFENTIYKSNKRLDKRFIFFNSGYNLRPTEVSAAIGHNQFKRLNKFISIRNFNKKKIILSMKKNMIINKKIDFYYENKNVTPSWFGLPIKILVNKKKYKNIIIKKLEKNGIETRPIISGNFADQPAAKKYNLTSNNKFPNTDFVYNNSFFIGLPTKKIDNKYLKKIVFAFENSFK